MKTRLSPVIALVCFSFYLISCKNDAKEKQEINKPVKSIHDAAFNVAMDTILSSYYDLTESFVSWDSSGISRHGSDLKMALDSFALDDLVKDSAVHASAFEPLSNARVEINSIIADPSWEEKRASFNLLSDNLKTFLTTVKYDGSKIYWQECPMAFDDTKPGYWLSPVDSIRNPYLGIHHPKYGSGMLECGGTKEVIDFMHKDSTGKK
jgi:Cu(I)/Ag(I) efflux system membrane fusion protein